MWFTANTRTSTSVSHLGFDVSRSSSVPSVRPQFKMIPTSERLREVPTLKSLVSKISGKIRKGRTFVFKEVGLDDDGSNTPLSPTSPFNAALPVGHSNGSRALLESRSRRSLQLEVKQDGDGPNTITGSSHRQRQDSMPAQPWYTRFTKPNGRPRVKSASDAPPQAAFGFQRFAIISFIIAIVFPAFSFHSRRSKMDISGADAGLIRARDISPEVCTRWAHQAASVNGTLYIYGGQSKLEEDQDQNTWNSNFLTLDLNQDWSINAPELKGLEASDGPPAVAMGYLWQDYNNLYLYGGQFSDSPYVDPSPESLWRYAIKEKEWTEFPNPETSKGNFSAPANEPVHRAAEGAGISVPELGLSWYFGGHLDWATTPGWSRDTERIYLKSLLEFTHPGYMNSGVEILSDGAGAADGGIFRNITTGGVQTNNFPERADGVLVFVPGWGEMGVLIGLAGGTADTFTHDLGILDVYDIANSKWFNQATSGDPPSVRVNPCAVIASAPDASSFQIYMFGGQNLQPYKDQKQYDDIYILTIPSFTWIKVDSSENTPHPRAGHTCTMRDGQIVVVGGYIGKDIACDSPGIYVFDASALKWQSEFRAGDHEPNFHPDNGVLAASFGYSIPEPVQKIIGGDAKGGATVTTPAAGPATDGPFATGKAPVFTVTAIPTAMPNESNNENDRTNPGLIAAGVVAGILGSLALYLGFCTWLYRRQVQAYKQHLAAANRYSGDSSIWPTTSAIAGLTGGLFASSRKSNPSDGPSLESEETFGWVGSEREPKLNSDEPTLGSSGGVTKRSEEMRNSISGESTEGLLEGQEPSFFSVVMGPRRALRVVNGVD